MDQDPRPVPSLPATTTSPSDDWPARAADLVETVVGLLRDKTIRPLTLAARAAVFGIIVLAAAAVTMVFISISLVRLLTVYAFDGRVWASDLLIGSVFVLVGLTMWTHRADRKAGTRSAR
ncbi:MAG: hypothetical protein ACYCV7_09745 [Acidimicrobiales bacterium]